MNIGKKLLLSLAVVGAIGLSAVPVSVGAVNVFEPCTNGADAGSKVCADPNEDAGGILIIVVNTLLFILGAISTIVIIIGGIMYATSGGDSSGVTRAKNTILYAVIGLVVALLAFAIVNYVIAQFVPTPPTP